MTLTDLVIRLNRLGLSYAAQVVERYSHMASELHAARQRVIALETQVTRLDKANEAMRVSRTDDARAIDKLNQHIADLEARLAPAPSDIEYPHL